MPTQERLLSNHVFLLKALAAVENTLDIWVLLSNVFM